MKLEDFDENHAIDLAFLKPSSGEEDLYRCPPPSALSPLNAAFGSVIFTLLSLPKPPTLLPPLL